MPEPGWRHEVYRYRDIELTPAFLARARLRPSEARSLRAHPYASAEDAAGVLLVRGERTVGAIRLIPGRVRIGERDHALSWTSSWEFVGAPEDSPGAGLLVVRSLSEAPSIAVCGVSDRSREIFRYARFDEVRLPRRATLLRSRPFLRRRMPDAIARAAAVVIDRALLAVRRARWRRVLRAAGELSLERVERFDERVDRVDALSRGPLWFPRDHRELNWVLERPWSEDPAYRYRAFLLRRGRDIAGYALARLKPVDGGTLGSFLRVGLAAVDAVTARALVAHVARALEREGADTIELCSTRTWLLRAADDLGMSARGGIEVMTRFGAAAAGDLERHGLRAADMEADLGEGDLMFF